MAFGIVRGSAVVVLVCSAVLGRAAPPPSFDLRVPAPPMARAMEGGQELVYELHLDNHARRDLQPVRVDVLDAATGQVLVSYEGPSLEQRLDRSGLQWQAETFEAIPSGRRGVVFIELLLPDALPATLRHRVRFVDPVQAQSAATVEGGITRVVEGRTPVLAPPLDGGPWVAVYDPRWTRGHRRVGYALGGALRTPGRYAVDWVKVDAAGRKAAAGNDLAARTYSHGQPVLAVADGRVHQVHDSAPERTRLADPVTDAEGNRIVLQLDNGYYAHYGHLRPGSATVAPGMRVRAGDRIADVGFSGSASDPQLHFALTDGPDELASEGIAYTFDRYRLLGRYEDVSQVGRGAWTPANVPRAAGASMPAAMSVVHWGDRDVAAGSQDLQAVPPGAR